MWRFFKSGNIARLSRTVRDLIQVYRTEGQVDKRRIAGYIRKG